MEILPPSVAMPRHSRVLPNLRRGLRERGVLESRIVIVVVIINNSESVGVEDEVRGEIMMIIIIQQTRIGRR